MFNRFLTSLLLISALTGCGGGGSDIDYSAPKPIDGIWRGSIELDSQSSIPAVGVVLETGEYFFATGTSYAGIAFGSAKSVWDRVNSADMVLYDQNLKHIRTGSSTGTVAPSVRLSLVLSNTDPLTGVNYSNKADLSFDKEYNTVPSLAAIAGSYSGAYPGRRLDEQPISYAYAVDSAGNLSGDWGTCRITGKLSPQNTKNTYSLKLTPTPGLSCDDLHGQPKVALTGVATYISLPNETAKSLLLMATGRNADSTWGWVTAAGVRQP